MTEKGKMMALIRKRSVRPVLLLLLAAELLGGCVPKRYSKSQEEALIRSCLPAVEEFLAERYGEYELGELCLQKGIIEPEKALYGRFGSNVVRGSYTVGGNTWDLVYDRETGDFYTGELLDRLREQEEARMLKYLKEELPEEDLAGFRVTVLDIYYLVQSHGIRIDSSTAADTYVYITNVLPAGITEADLPAFAERGFDGGTVSSIRCHYYSDRKNALTDEAFQTFFADNPAYQVQQYLLIENDNPSAKEEESTQETAVWFHPEPAGKDSDCRIEYESGAVLARRPCFTESDGVVTMQFNAIDWYSVRVIRREEKVKKYFRTQNCHCLRCRSTGAASIPG